MSVADFIKSPSRCRNTLSLCLPQTGLTPRDFRTCPFINLSSLEAQSEIMHPVLIKETIYLGFFFILPDVANKLWLLIFVK